MKIAMVVGSREAQFCGVKDYALRLAEALRGRGHEVEVVAWEKGKFFKFYAAMRGEGFDVVHVQYPAIGFGYSLWPMMLGWMGLGRVFVTVHEYGSLPWVQRVAMRLFRWSAEGILFTTEGEKKRFGGPGAVVPIGSNVPEGNARVREKVMVYFGQIRPGKGIEEFLALARVGVAGVKFVVMGAGLDKGYLDGLRTPEVGFVVDAPMAGVAERLAGAMGAYLPFPDGATWKRGSLLAVMENGVPVITTVSAETPGELAEVVLHGDVRGWVERLRDDREFAVKVGERGREAVRGFGWDGVAEGYEEAYGWEQQERG